MGWSPVRPGLLDGLPRFSTSEQHSSDSVYVVADLGIRPDLFRDWDLKLSQSLLTSPRRRLNSWELGNRGRVEVREGVVVDICPPAENPTASCDARSPFLGARVARPAP